MSTTNDGGPAFPRASGPEPRVNSVTDYCDGMSLRDWFAGQALGALIAKLPLFDRMGEHGIAPPDIHQVRKDAAESAYDYADAMLAERAKEVTR